MLEPSTCDRNRVACLLAATVCCVFIGVAATRADDADARERFDRRYGFKLKLIRDTERRADDADYAAELFTEARASDGDPAMQVLLARHAASLVDNYPPAEDLMLDALQMLNRIDPDSRAENYARIAAIHQQRFAAAADEHVVIAGNRLIEALTALARIEHRTENWEKASEHYRAARQVAISIKSDRVDEIVAQMELAKKAQHVEVDPERLKEAIKQNKDDKEAIAHLLYTYIVERDQPSEARKYTFLVNDESLNEHIRIASRPLDSLKPEECLTAADWYRHLVARAPTFARPALRGRAAMYLDRYRALTGSDAPTPTISDARKLALKPAPLTGEAPDSVRILDILRPRSLDPTTSPSSPSAAWLHRCLETMPGNVTVAMHLTFDENVGSDAVIDQSAYRNLVLNVSTLYDTGHYGRARRLTGAGSYLTTKPAAAIDPSLRPVAVGLWIRPDKESGVVFAHGDSTNGYAIYLKDNRLHLATRSNTTLFEAHCPDRVPTGWVHVGMILTEGKVTLTVNGEPCITKPHTYLPARPADGIDIGTDDNGHVGGYTDATRHFAGLVYEVTWLVGQRLR